MKKTFLELESGYKEYKAEQHLGNIRKFLQLLQKKGAWDPSVKNALREIVVGSFFLSRIELGKFCTALFVREMFEELCLQHIVSCNFFSSACNIAALIKPALDPKSNNTTQKNVFNLVILEEVVCQCDFKQFEVLRTELFKKTSEFLSQQLLGLGKESRPLLFSDTDLFLQMKPLNTLNVEHKNRSMFTGKIEQASFMSFTNNLVFEIDTWLKKHQREKCIRKSRVFESTLENLSTTLQTVLAKERARNNMDIYVTAGEIL